ncbi:MAG: ClbS/DfsB family four-helix bundle protein [Defluviitaleaceae bacterium]|nr:ClbS/DfsB family four-helix bundle protein [Defluviitaleaceae bacterium]MCL2836147.1 ClbS/DfsB family four-helix bundle protein [Defluviitaleaceae bacterium]
MPRPTTKSDLIEAANEGFKKLRKLIDSMTDEEQNAPIDFGDTLNKKEAHWARDKNLRDILTHLYEWHKLLLNWVKANQSGDVKPFIPEPYNWKTYGVMNIDVIWKKHQNTSYSKSKEMLNESHAEVIKLIEAFTNDELFAKKAFAWVGGSALGSYCVSVTASHYEWAMKKIKMQIKAIRAS